MGRPVTFGFHGTDSIVAARRHASESVMAADFHSRKVVKGNSQFAWDSENQPTIEIFNGEHFGW
jgi:hypothetical protein